MRWIYLILIFVFTLFGGMIPLWYRKMNKNVMIYLLTFTGAFLLGITILHLIPETFQELGYRKAGIYILVGFLLQVFLQQWSRGMEHGHHFPVDEDEEAYHSHGLAGHTHVSASVSTAFSLVVGLSVHAFMAGMPLGFTYEDPSVLPSLSIGILLHKIPEAVTLMTMILTLRQGRTGNIRWLIAFALVTPGAAIIAYILSRNLYFMDTFLLYAIAIVSGTFLHIATTIFFESGTRHHEIKLGKIISMIIGLGISGLTLLMP